MTIQLSSAFIDDLTPRVNRPAEASSRFFVKADASMFVEAPRPVTQGEFTATLVFGNPKSTIASSRPTCNLTRNVAKSRRFLATIFINASRCVVAVYVDHVDLATLLNLKTAPVFPSVF